MDYLSIKNWDTFQHYKDRNPPWIKFYHSLLDDYDYACLHDDSKLLLISLYLLAAKTNNQIPYDIAWIRQKAMIKGKINLQPLLDIGFINLIATCKQNDSIMLPLEEKRREYTTTETDIDSKRAIKTIYGIFKNVKLTDEELQKLKDKFGDILCNEKIEKLSEYIASKGKKYSSHYATILSWSRKDGNEGNNTGRPNSFLEGLRKERG